MTREEAVLRFEVLKDFSQNNELKNMHEAIDIAIRSLEAWDAVVGEITEYIEEYNDAGADGNHSPKWCAMKEAESVIKKYLKEVEDDNRRSN